MTAGLYGEQQRLTEGTPTPATPGIGVITTTRHGEFTMIHPFMVM